MMKRIILLVVAVSLVCSISSGALAQGDTPPPPMNCIPPRDDSMTGLDMAFLVTGVFMIGANFVLIGHNSESLKTGKPSGGGAMAGMLFGSFSMILGAAMLYSEEYEVKFAGVGSLVAGGISMAYGVMTARETNRKYDEKQKQGFRLEPVILYGRGSPEPGVQVSWRF
jgi:hypothetical protein